MALSARLNEQPPRGMTGMPCSVQILLDKLAAQPAELAAFEAMMADPSWSASQIRKAVAAEGYEVGQQTVGRHRTQSCRCFKAAS